MIYFVMAVASHMSHEMIAKIQDIFTWFDTFILSFD